MRQERAYDLKQIRALAGFTQKDAAKLLNIHPLTYLNLEKNPGRLTLDQATLLAEAAGIGIEQIKTHSRRRYGHETTNQQAPESKG